MKESEKLFDVYREFKLKLLSISNDLANFMEERRIPANAFPRDFYSAIGGKKVSFWWKMTEKKARLTAFITSIIFMPMGFDLMAHDHSLLGLPIFVFGAYSAYFLFQMHEYDREKYEKMNS